MAKVITFKIVQTLFFLWSCAQAASTSQQKWSGEQSQIFEAYSQEVVRINEIARSVITT